MNVAQTPFRVPDRFHLARAFASYQPKVHTAFHAMSGERRKPSNAVAEPVVKAGRQCGR